LVNTLPSLLKSGVSNLISLEPSNKDSFVEGGVSASFSFQPAHNKGYQTISPPLLNIPKLSDNLSESFFSYWHPEGQHDRKIFLN